VIRKVQKISRKIALPSRYPLKLSQLIKEGSSISATNGKSLLRGQLFAKEKYLAKKNGEDISPKKEPHKVR
jgi:hypothetical protein